MASIFLQLLTMAQKEPSTLWSVLWVPRVSKQGRPKSTAHVFSLWFNINHLCSIGRRQYDIEKNIVWHRWWPHLQMRPEKGTTEFNRIPKGELGDYNEKQCWAVHLAAPSPPRPPPKPRTLTFEWTRWRSGRKKKGAFLKWRYCNSWMVYTSGISQSKMDDLGVPPFKPQFFCMPSGFPSSGRFPLGKMMKHAIQKNAD